MRAALGSAPGCRVVAREDVEEMPPSAQPGLAAAVLLADHLADLPAREGTTDCQDLLGDQAGGRIGC
jgi:hypothetical protein